MLDYTQLDTLATVLRLGSFDSAAQHLRVTQSAVSQRIRQLEETIGCPLIHRGPPATGTEAGLKLARHAEEVRMLEARVVSPSDGQSPRLRVAVNADSLATWFLKVMACHPEFQFEIVVDDQDHSLDWLKRGEVSAVVTSEKTPPQGCISHPLGAMNYAAVCSPNFARIHFRGAVDKLSLADAPVLVFNNKDGLQATWQKQFFGVIHNRFSNKIPSTQGFIDAALLDLGWGLNPQSLVDPFLADGSLQRLVPDSDLQVPLFWHHSRLLSDALAELTGSVKLICKAELQPKEIINTQK